VVFQSYLKMIRLYPETPYIHFAIHAVILEVIDK